jgi:hypothetical protein
MCEPARQRASRLEMELTETYARLGYRERQVTELLPKVDELLQARAALAAARRELETLGLRAAAAQESEAREAELRARLDAALQEVCLNCTCGRGGGLGGGGREMAQHEHPRGVVLKPLYAKGPLPLPHRLVVLRPPRNQPGGC